MARQHSSSSEVKQGGMSHTAEKMQEESKGQQPPMIDRRRAHAIEIMLSRFGRSNGKSLEAIAAAVRTLDYSMLSIDDVFALRRYQLTSDERERFRQYLVTSDTKEGFRGDAQKRSRDQEVHGGNLCARAKCRGDGSRSTSNDSTRNFDDRAADENGWKPIDQLGKAEMYLVIMARVPQVRC